MDFEQTGPGRAEAADGTTVELLDRHHARLDGPDGTWLVELGPGDDEDWFGVRVYPDSLVRSGGPTSPGAQDEALARLLAGIRSLRVRVEVTQALDDPDEVVATAPDDN